MTDLEEKYFGIVRFYQKSQFEATYLEIDERFVDKFIKYATVSLDEIVRQGDFINKKVCYIRIINEKYTASLSVKICQGRGD